ncbi:MAG: hypothetical protein A3J74_06875 [Elusimicrobia bacterium RIFCSPHIGHO2_02_FULL_57_9]|nr:MAG: hypothetical protein A3J74_06875 [Elusimicrobia bacterium RIFCSPHIGHO2_02_FULL_57_9]
MLNLILIFAAAAEDIIRPALFWSGIEQARIVYAGEKHDEASHHEVQLQIIQRFDNPVIGLEMLDRTQQPILDEYINNGMPDSDFKKFWEQNWGSYELYRPILEYARARRLSVKALNMPGSVASQIYKGGLASLTPEQRRLLPAEIHPIEDARYLEYVKKAAEEHTSDPVRIGYIIEAMQAWNETMGESLSRLVPMGRPLVVVAGAGHMIYRAGIPASVERRAAATQTVVLPYPFNGEQMPQEELVKNLKDPALGHVDFGDYFWLLPAKSAIIPKCQLSPPPWIIKLKTSA